MRNNSKSETEVAINVKDNNTISRTRHNKINILHIN